MCLVATDGNITWFNIPRPETHLNNIQKLYPLDRNSTRSHSNTKTIFNLLCPSKQRVKKSISRPLTFIFRTIKILYLPTAHNFPTAVMAEHFVAEVSLVSFPPQNLRLPCCHYRIRNLKYWPRDVLQRHVVKNFVKIYQLV
jgi:hypothetical protein